MKAFFDKFNIDNIRYEFPKNNSSINYKTCLLLINKFIDDYKCVKKNGLISHHEIVINNKKMVFFILSKKYRRSIVFSYRINKLNWFLYHFLIFHLMRKYKFLKNDVYEFHTNHLTIEGKKYYL